MTGQTANPNEPKKHHYFPQFYMRQFARRMVTLANKNARMIWAMMTSAERYRELQAV